jgi:hypothetical protein
LAAATNLPSVPGIRWPRLKSQIIGAFEGGHAYNCEVYHPSGDCVMLDPINARQFCHVCRYAMVDQIDPLQHGAIDRDYEKIYPR